MKKENSVKLSFMHLTLLLVGFLTTIYSEVSAIPAFARKYKTACATCHLAIPKRNAFGEAFRRNGYVMPEQNARLVKEPPVSLGAEAWKEAWPDAVWPGDLPSTVPLALYSNLRFNYNIPSSQVGKQAQFDFPQILMFMAGGAFGESIGFFGEWIAFLEGANTPSLGRFFLQFNSIVGPKNLLNIKVGRFEPGITDGYMSTQRLTLGYPITQGYKAAGDWEPRDAQSGIEVNGIFSHRFEYAIGVVNGNGKTIDNLSDRKDIFSRIAYKFGGLGLDGKRFESDSSQIDPNQENSFTLGLYTYHGNTEKTGVNNNLYNNNFTRFGLDADMRYGRADFLGGVIFGTDENPRADNRQLKSIAYFIESNYIFYPWLMGLLRFEKVKSTINDDDADNYWNIIPNITILYRLNLRFSIEGMINIQNDKVIKGQVVTANNHDAFQWIKLNLLFAF